MLYVHVSLLAVYTASLKYKGVSYQNDCVTKGETIALCSAQNKNHTHTHIYI
jgi:hypothetical protein